MEQESIELLKSIDKKLSQKKKDFWDILGLASTFTSTVIIAFLGIYFSNLSDNESRKFQQSVNDKEAIFRKTELIEKFSPLLYVNDSIKNKVAILGMYTLDSNLALKLAELINSPGTQSAMKTLFKTVDTGSQRSIENVLLNISNANADTLSTNNAESIYQKALKKAVSQIGMQEDSSIPAEKSNIQKFFIDSKIPPGNEWSTAFIAWCYLSDSAIEKSLDYMRKTNSLELYNSMKEKGCIIYNKEAPKPGDIVFFDIASPGKIDKTGIVYQYENGLLYTIEGDGSRIRTIKKRVRKLALVYAYGRVK